MAVQHSTSFTTHIDFDFYLSYLNLNLEEKLALNLVFRCFSLFYFQQKEKSAKSNFLPLL